PRLLAGMVAFARADRDGLRGDRVELGDGRGQPLGRARDHAVERTAIAPRVLGRAAQRAGLAVDQLRPGVVVAGGAAQLVDHARLLAAQRARGPMRLVEPRPLPRVLGRRRAELADLAREVVAIVDRRARARRDRDQALDLAQARARLVLQPARSVEGQPALLRVARRLALGLLVLAGLGLDVGSEHRMGAREPGLAIGVLGQRAL